MSKLVKIKVRGDGSSDTVLVEASGGSIERIGAGSQIVDALDTSLDHLVQHEIVENCRVLVGAFEQLQKQSLKPAKATAEFGLQLTGQGNIFVVSASAQSSYKITLEWQLAPPEKTETTTHTP